MSVFPFFWVALLIVKVETRDTMLFYAFELTVLKSRNLMQYGMPDYGRKKGGCCLSHQQALLIRNQKIHELNREKIWKIKNFYLIFQVANSQIKNILKEVTV